MHVLWAAHVSFLFMLLVSACMSGTLFTTCCLTTCKQCTKNASCQSLAFHCRSLTWQLSKYAVSFAALLESYFPALFADVDVEFDDICEAAAASRATGNQWKTILKPAYRPQLMLAIIVPALQQLTGINSVIFYAPQLFESLGSGTEMALLTTVIIGAVNVCTTVVAMVSVDK